MTLVTAKVLLHIVYAFWWECHLHLFSIINCNILSVNLKFSCIYFGVLGQCQVVCSIVIFDSYICHAVTLAGLHFCCVLFP